MLTALWRSAGFQNIEETAIEMWMPFNSFDDFWQPHLNGVAPQGAYVASLSEERREAFREGLRRRLFADRPEGSFSLRAKALAVRGKVPN